MITAFVLALAALGPPIQGPPKPPDAGFGAQAVDVTFLANEGVLLRAGSTAVLIDALVREGVVGYPTPRPADRARVEQARPPFDADLVLASHAHADHFDPGAVTAFLASRPSARFVSTPQAVAKLPASVSPRVEGILPAAGARQHLRHGDVSLTVFNLHHGRGPTQNLGLLVELGGRRFLHVGDSEVSADELRPLRLPDERIDVAFLPYWWFEEENVAARLSAIGARQVVAVHLLAPDAPKDYFTPHDSLPALAQALRRRHPTVTLAEKLFAPLLGLR